ncbi:uncharacterized protein L203_101319 [Cryptococcus depauperatus CBS 7841]|uniref:Laccase n=1 Tax=Cryptococcus depauperatus CBS 7841 TaxID=1295531 RepID=A0AAJ8LZK6_9TREE
MVAHIGVYSQLNLYTGKRFSQRVQDSSWAFSIKSTSIVSNSLSNMKNCIVTFVVFLSGLTCMNGQSTENYASKDLIQNLPPTITKCTDFVLSCDWQISDTPTIREYNWTISRGQGSPDGYSREVITVNGQFPGPLIEANAMDTIIVHVNNQLDYGQAIHWHGLFQKNTNYMDGVPGVTQCPIPPGGSFTYELKPNGQYGTYWWHSHFANTMADGLSGPLIIHSTKDTLKRGQDYDEDRIVWLMDWMHDTSDVIVKAILSPQGYRGTNALQGDSVLINAYGSYSCSDCTTPAPAEIQVPVNSRVRLRFINAAAHAMFRVSLDEHPLEVVETDGELVYGPTVHEIPLAPGERISAIIKTTQGQAGAAFWIRSRVASKCILRGFHDAGQAILRYTGNEEVATVYPTTSSWNDLTDDDGNCVALDEIYELIPRNVMAAEAVALQTHVLNSKIGTFLNHDGDSMRLFAFNNISYQNQINQPLLLTIMEGGTLNSALIANAVFDRKGAGNIIVNNLDAAIDHPYHLHGNNFQLIGRGTGALTEANLSNVCLNLTNPVRKDTLWIPANSWALLRIMTDNPGVHAIHCHIGWHLAMGKLAAVVVQPEAIKEINLPDAWSDLCVGTDPNAWGPG